MACIIGRKIDYKGVGVLRGHRQNPAKIEPSTPPPPPVYTLLSDHLVANCEMAFGGKVPWDVLSPYPDNNSGNFMPYSSVSGCGSFYL